MTDNGLTRTTCAGAQLNGCGHTQLNGCGHWHCDLERHDLELNGRPSLDDSHLAPAQRTMNTRDAR
jgi:hypothetical protein